MEITKSELKQLLEVMEQKGISVTEAIELIKAHDGTNIEEQRIEAQLSEERLTEAQCLEMGEEVNLVVDYTKTVEEMMELAGLKNELVTSKNFPIPKNLLGKKVNIKVKLVNYGPDSSSEYTIAQMNKEGFREGIIFEQIALASIYRGAQRRFSIMALGSILRDADGVHGSPVLNTNSGRRQIVFYWLVGDCLNYCHFLAVRKETPGHLVS